LYLAKSYENYAGFEGDIQDWYFLAGTGAYTTPSDAECEIPGSCDVNPIEDSSCAYLYSECDFAGTSTKICSSSPYTDIDYVVMSVKVPDNQIIYLYNLPCFNGNTVTLSQDIDCIDDVRPFDFSLLGIKLVTDEKQGKLHAGSFSATYKQKGLRRASGKDLKSFKRWLSS